MVRMREKQSEGRAKTCVCMTQEQYKLQDKGKLERGKLGHTGSGCGQPTEWVGRDMKFSCLRDPEPNLERVGHNPEHLPARRKVGGWG